MKARVLRILALAVCAFVIGLGTVTSACRKESEGEAAPAVADEKPAAREVAAHARTDTMPNRLLKEKSPYLLQHAYNPVDWYPWGKEAFEKARKEDKPIFLSIGYSTCHWCHVMERESFSNPEIAAMMNEHFVSIKVDREERPDIDNIYMTAVQAMTGSGGWPLTVFMTPDGKPFYGGTYFPPEDRHGRPGIKSVMLSVVGAWKEERSQTLERGEALTTRIRSLAEGKPGAGTALTAHVLKKGFETLGRTFDAERGGFGAAPKFPRSHTLSFLLRYWKRTGEPQALAMVEKTLQAMNQGGMYDHLGGGFHRYSTDSLWRVPHFEKMLYDQATLARTYLEAYQATRNLEYARVAREIFDYVLRDMTSPEGGFYSAEDADSLPPEASEVSSAEEPEKREGAFYVWPLGEIQSALGKEEAEIFAYRFGIEPQGNVENDPHGEFGEKNVLYIARDLDAVGKQFKKNEAETARLLEGAKAKLFELRKARPRPYLDDKALTDWNGLMIGSLAFGSRVLDEPRYREASRRAADFVLDKLVRRDGRLLHRYREGEAGILGTIEDYAFLSYGLFDLYEATFDTRYLAEAKRITAEMEKLFWDEEGGGFFFSGRDAEKLISRTKEIYDGAIPSGNSVAALSLLRVGHLTVDERFMDRADALFKTFSNTIEMAPSAYPQMLIALDFAIGPSREIVIAGVGDTTATQAMLEAIYERFLPNKVVALRPASDNTAKDIVRLAPFLELQKPIQGGPTAYVCENYICNLPTNDIEKMKKLLDKKLTASRQS